MRNLRPFFQRLGLGALAGLVATVAYRGIQHGTEARAIVRSDCWAWGWLPFAGAWIWPYLSMFLIMALPWFLLPEWGQVKRFARVLLGMAAVGWVVFLVHPTACARPGGEGQPLAYVVLLAMDRPNNCLPCLHSAMAVLAACVLGQGVPAFRGWGGRAVLAAWVALMAVSIVALRQHTDVDMALGAVLGGLAAGWWHYGERASRVSNAA